MAKAPKTFLVTGSTGFIGAAVVRCALARGHHVVLLLREDSDCSRIEDIMSQCTVQRRDVPDQELVTSLAMHKPDSWLHLAWKGVAGDDRNEAFQALENIPAALHSLRLAAAAGCSQWIGAGSHAEYGNPNCRVGVGHPTLPTTVYGKAKLATCWASQAAAQGLGIKTVWMRIFTTFGPGDSPEWVIPYMVREFSSGRRPQLTKCEQKWDFLYHDDAASAFVIAAETGLGGVYNLGSGRAVALREVVEEISALAGQGQEPLFGTVPYREDQVMHLQADVSDLQKACEWEPSISLEEGLKRTVDQYRLENEMPSPGLD